MGTVAHHRDKARYFLHRARDATPPLAGPSSTTPAPAPAKPRTPSPPRSWNPPPPCAAPPPTPPRP